MPPPPPGLRSDRPFLSPPLPSSTTGEHSGLLTPHHSPFPCRLGSILIEVLLLSPTTGDPTCWAMASHSTLIPLARGWWPVSWQWDVNQSLLGVPGKVSSLIKWTPRKKRSSTSCHSHLLPAEGEAPPWGVLFQEYGTCHCPCLSLHFLPWAALFWRLHPAWVLGLCPSQPSAPLTPCRVLPSPGSTRVSPPRYTRNPTTLHPAPHNVSLEGGGHLLPRAMPCSPPPLSPCAGCRPDISKSVPQSRLKQCISYKTSTDEPACFSLCNTLQVHEVLDFWTRKTFLSPLRLIISFYYRPPVSYAQFQKSKYFWKPRLFHKLVANAFHGKTWPGQI